MNEYLLAALTAVLGGLVGCYFGHWLTISLHKRRGGALQQGVHHELDLLNSRLKGWIPDLYDEFIHPKRKTYSGYLGFDFKYVDAIVIELIGHKEMLKGDQRIFIENLKIRMEKIIKSDAKRDKASDFTGGNHWIFVDRDNTGHLIHDVAEVVYYIDAFLREGESFCLNRDFNYFDLVLKGLAASGINTSNEVLKDLKLYCKK